MDAIHEFGSDNHILGIRHFGMQHEIVTAVLTGSIRRRIVGDILQRTRDRLRPDGNIALEIRDGLAEQVLSSGDIRIN